MNDRKNFGKEKLSLDVINKAANGDIESMNALLNHYTGYIITLSTRKFYDEEGNQYKDINIILRNYLERLFIAKVMKYKMNLSE